MLHKMLDKNVLEVHTPEADDAEREPYYIVRRLTPLECCRLQGFPDGWADIPHKTEMTQAELAFWRKVYKTHRDINGKSAAAAMFKSDDSVIKWYNSLHTDASEYKMWGNGMAAPNAKFVISRACEHLRTLPSYGGTITLGSMFDGSGTMLMVIEQEVDGAAVWASEVEPYPIAVTRHNLPHMQHLGSVTDFDGGKVAPVDIITFGSPCQDMSVAGRRAGLGGERSGLFYAAIDRIKEMYAATGGKYPKIVIWENVPGAFSSNGGKDFECVLNELLHIAHANEFIRLRGKRWNNAADYGAVAYRTFDAQFWGVPQRRRRIYAIADITGERAGEILFERDGVPWRFAAGGKAWQGAAAAIESGAVAGDSAGTVYCLQGNGVDRADTANFNGKGVKADISYTLNTIDRHCVAYEQVAGFCHFAPSGAGTVAFKKREKPDTARWTSRRRNDTQTPYAEGGYGDYIKDRVGTLKATGGVLGGGSETFIVEARGDK